jgi:hypothetical protein
MLAAWLLARSRWARYFYRLGAYDQQVPSAYGVYAARRRASGLLDRPRHRAEDREPNLPGSGAWEVGVG